MMWLLEKLVRIHDQLDEQLHAGFYFYILTAPSKFISNNQFIWALAILLVGLGAPLILDYLNHEMQKQEAAKVDEEKRIKTKKDYSQQLAILFMVLAYLIGFLMTLMPSFYLNFVRPWFQEAMAETEQRNLLIE